MADLGLDVDALRRDRDRYRALLAQAEEQISAWNERADFVQQAIGGIDRLLSLAGADIATDAGPAQHLLPGRGVTPTVAAPTAAVASRPAVAPAAKKRPAPPVKKAAVRSADPIPTTSRPEPERPSAATSPDPSSDDSSTDALDTLDTPRATPPVAVAPDAPKGTDAVRIVLETDPGRSFTLSELLAELEERHWLAPSRRPEELVRINLKRLAERGGATRADDGRWKAAPSGGASPAHDDAEQPQQSQPQPSSQPPPPATNNEPVGLLTDPPPVVGSTVREW